MVIPIAIVSEEEIRKGKSIYSVDETLTEYNLPALKKELKTKIEEYEKENGYPIDLKDEIPDDIADLISKIDRVKSNLKNMKIAELEEELEYKVSKFRSEHEKLPEDIKNLMGQILDLKIERRKEFERKNGISLICNDCEYRAIVKIGDKEYTNFLNHRDIEENTKCGGYMRQPSNWDIDV